MTLTIAITSDFICPWCLVAETRLNQAIAQLNSAVEIEYLWFPFELNPQMPEAGMDRKAYRTGKFGSWEYSQGLDAKTVQATQADNINFRYDLMTVTPNTLKAHRLTWFAGNQGKATQMAVRIFNAYFTEGRNIGDVETLATLAAEIGIDAAQVKAFLESEAGIQEVKDLEQQAMSTTGYAYAQGIHGVPAIRIGREIISGAQSVEVFLAALQQATNELATA
ncbi:MAG: DsbA family oxidoreductase [Nostoc sp.]|uniref:DsbA family oxidoreductase n=1 Tax=Nostoc sp. TaxID=1180 RepID=UPI002FF51BEB